MKKIKFKLMALGLSFVIGLTSVAVFPVNSLAKDKYPTEWDLTLLYKDEDEWNEDYEKADKLLDEVESYRGKLNNAEDIYDYFQFVEFSEYNELFRKMNAYATYGKSLDASDTTFSKMETKVKTLNAKKETVTAFAEPEIFEMSLSERKRIFSDPVFKDMKYWLRKYTDPDYKPLSEDEKVVLSTLEAGQGYTQSVYGILSNLEIPSPMITMPDGTEQELTDQLYDEIVYGKDYDDNFKAEANKLICTKYKGYANTYAQLLEGKMKEEYAKAKVKGFDSTMECAFDAYDMDTTVYDMLIETAHESSADMQRFNNIHKEALGLKKQYPYHMQTYVSDYYPEKVKYEDGMDEVLKALSVLGTDYTDEFKKILTSGHIDVYPKKGKESGAYMDQTYYADLPWVLYNFNGLPSYVSTLAHEMGHAVYAEFSAENQPPQYSDPYIFTHEVASLTNEILFNSYRINNAKDDEEKLYYLEAFISRYQSAYIGQMMYAEFEDYCYKKVEAGEGLDAEDLSDKYKELLDTYRGDSITAFPDSRYSWIEIPHFYYVYYVYQYSADITYATTIAGKILDGDKDALKQYKEFLKLGSSADPVTLLKKAGVDPLSQDTYDYAIEYYKKLVDEYEELVKARK